jgi:hypothetical protein
MIKSIRNNFACAMGLALSFFGSAYAQSAFFKNESGGALEATTKGSLSESAITIVNYALGFLGIIAVILIIYGGILMVTSAGNEEAVGKAKKIITYAAIGIVIIILSYSIVTFVSNVMNG